MLLIFLSSVIVSVLACVGASYFSRHDLRRAPWVSLFFVALLLVLPLGSLLPKLELTVTKAAEIGAPAHGVSLVMLALGLWSVGCIVMIVRLLRDGQAFRKWMNASTVIKEGAAEVLLKQIKKDLSLTREVMLLERADLASPVVAGLIRPKIVLPLEARSWSEETLRMALLHELGHVKRGDLWAASFAKLSCVIYWFNPLVHRLKQRLLNQCEYACDAWVISKGANRRAYALALCDVVESLKPQQLPNATLAMAGAVPLSERVKLMASPVCKCRSLFVGLFLILTFTLGFLVTSLELVPQGAGKSLHLPTTGEVQLRMSANPFPLD